jgi:hypothetical protein
MRNTEGAKKACFGYYQEHILIPGINLQRKKYCNFDITAGTTIPDMATAVAWCDIRLANVSQESYQRSKCLTHLHHVDLHLERLQTIKLKEIQKTTTANMKHEERGGGSGGGGSTAVVVAARRRQAARRWLLDIDKGEVFSMLTILVLLSSWCTNNELNAHLCAEGKHDTHVS